jgi:hypothetical protein
MFSGFVYINHHWLFLLHSIRKYIPGVAAIIYLIASLHVNKTQNTEFLHRIAQTQTTKHTLPTIQSDTRHAYATRSKQVSLGHTQAQPWFVDCTSHVLQFLHNVFGTKTRSTWCTMLCTLYQLMIPRSCLWTINSDDSMHSAFSSNVLVPDI